MSVWTTAGLIADGSFDDPENARVIYLAAGGLLLLAVLLGLGTWLWWRSAKVEHPALAPLEVMGTRRWWKGDFTERRRRLDEVRPVHDDGTGLEPEVHVDLDQVMVREDPHSFDDLLDPVAADLSTAEDLEAEVEAEVVEGEVVAGEVVAAEAVEVEVVQEEAVEEAVAASEVAAEAVEDEAVEDEAVEDEAVAGEVLAGEVLEGDVVAEPEPEVVPEPVSIVEPVVVELEPALEAVAAPDVAEEASPALTFEPVAAAPRSIVIDTAPKPRDTPSDLGPESINTETSAAPIDPLLRLKAD